MPNIPIPITASVEKYSHVKRCGWCGQDPLYQAYHDNEWGKPVWDTNRLFEKLCLEGQQAGLSWITVLKKRAQYRNRFFNFDPIKIAHLSDIDLTEMLQDAGLIRHIGKLTAIRDNAKALLALQEKQIDFAAWLWSFVDGKTIHNHLENYRNAPAQTEQSLAMSKALKKAGFKFVGPTTCYAFMQSMGMVNDHEVSCTFNLRA